jgi:hypothetical protein
MNWLNYLLGMATQYPELSAILGGTAMSWAPGLALEMWFLPETWTDRRIKQVTMGVTVGVATVTTLVLWTVLDKTPDKLAVMLLLSGAAALSAPMVHKAAAGVLTHFFPYLDSVFKFRNNL